MPFMRFLLHRGAAPVFSDFLRIPAAAGRERRRGRDQTRHFERHLKAASSRTFQFSMRARTGASRTSSFSTCADSSRRASKKWTWRSA